MRRGEGLGARGESTSKLEAHGDLIFDGDFRFQEKGIGQTFCKLDFHADRFAGPDHSLETDIIHPRSNGNLFIVTCDELRKQNRPALHCRFAKQNTRNKRKVRVMPFEKVFRAGEKLRADDFRFALLDDLIDQKKRRTVRNGGEYFFLGHAVICESRV